MVATLMRRMEIEAIYRKPNTSTAALGHKIYPYLLLGLSRRSRHDAPPFKLLKFLELPGVRSAPPKAPVSADIRQTAMTDLAGGKLLRVDHTDHRHLADPDFLDHFV